VTSSDKQRLHFEEHCLLIYEAVYSGTDLRTPYRNWLPRAGFLERFVGIYYVPVLYGTTSHRLEGLVTSHVHGCEHRRVSDRTLIHILLQADVAIYLLALATKSTKRRYMRSVIAYYQHGTCHTVTLAALLFASYANFFVW
jgi:hypothetical protein